MMIIILLPYTEPKDSITKWRAGRSQSSSKQGNFAFWNSNFQLMFPFKLLQQKTLKAGCIPGSAYGGVMMSPAI